MEETVSGRVNTDVEGSQVTQWALGTIADNLSGKHGETKHGETKHGETLFRALTQPEQLRTGSRGLSAASLQSTAIQVLAAKDLPALRHRLALNLGGVAEAYRKPLIAMLTEQRADNLRAQLELYAAGHLDDTAKKSLQGPLANYARQVLNQLMSVREEADTAGFGVGGRPTGVAGAAASGQGGGFAAGAPSSGRFGFGQASATELKGEQVEELAAGFYSPRLGSDVGKAILRAKSSDVALIRLGAAMPLSPVRQSFQSLIDVTWRKETATLADGQTLGDVVRDPGLLLVLKTIPWKNRAKVSSGSLQGSGAAASNGGAAKAEKGEDPAEKWRDATEVLVRAMFARFAAGGRKGGASAAPIKMPRGEVTGEYFLKWPEELPPAAKQLGVPAMTVHYLRMDTRDPNAGPTVLSQVRNRRTHPIAGGFWYENRLSQNGMLSSLDVMVTRKAPAAAPGVGGAYGGSGTGTAGSNGKTKDGPQGEVTTVELLFVEIADYSK